MTALRKSPPPEPAPPQQYDAARLREVVRDYVENMSKELCKLAMNNGLDSLAVIFDMAREEAARIRVSSDEHLDRP